MNTCPRRPDLSGVGIRGRFEAASPRTVGIDDLVADAHPVPLETKLANGGEWALEIGAEPPRLDAGYEKRIAADAEL